MTTILGVSSSNTYHFVLILFSFYDYFTVKRETIMADDGVDDVFVYLGGEQEVPGNVRHRH